MECRQTVTDDGDDIFLGAVSIVDIVTRQQSDPELRQVTAYLGSHSSSVPRAFKRVVHALTLRDNVLYKKNFAAGGWSWLLVVAKTYARRMLRVVTIIRLRDTLVTPVR